jgi:ABC-type amino acid transport substrate-binding protein
MNRFPLALLLVTAACSDLPKDADGTLDRVRSSHVLRVGLVPPPPGPLAAARGDYLARVAAATGARLAVREGASEALLLDLEQDRLDLVIAPTTPGTPWKTEVAVLKPLVQTQAEGGDEKERLLLTPIAKNGENAWVMLLEREARRGKPGA